MWPLRVRGVGVAIEESVNEQAVPVPVLLAENSGVTVRRSTVASANLEELLPSEIIATALRALPPPLPGNNLKEVIVDAWPRPGRYRFTLASTRNPIPAMHVWYWRLESCQFLPRDEASTKTGDLKTVARTDAR
jgi:hypothetical protein